MTLSYEYYYNKEADENLSKVPTALKVEGINPKTNAVVEERLAKEEEEAKRLNERINYELTYIPKFDKITKDDVPNFPDFFPKTFANILVDIINHKTCGIKELPNFATESQMLLSSSEVKFLLAFSFIGKWADDNKNFTGLLESAELAKESLNYFVNFFTSSKWYLYYLYLGTVDESLFDQDIKGNIEFNESKFFTQTSLIEGSNDESVSTVVFASKNIGGEFLNIEDESLQSKIFRKNPPLYVLRILKPTLEENEGIFFDIDQKSFCLMDAKVYSKEEEKDLEENIKRDLLKAIAAFENAKDQIVSGCWGCGDANGNIYLKFVIQLIAASYCNKTLLYSNFGLTEEQKENILKIGRTFNGKPIREALEKLFSIENLIVKSDDNITQFLAEEEEEEEKEEIQFFSFLF